MKVNLFNSKFLLAGTIMVSLALGLGSCEKDEPEVTKEEVKTVQISAESYLEWVYFSFEKGTVVTVDQDKAGESLDWDLGFLRYNARTNSGKSGEGQGGVLETNAMKLEDVTKLPSGSFVVDDEIKINSVKADGTPVMPPKTLNVPGNLKLTSWATFDNNNMSYTYNNNVFIVRTANGKYAKVIMKSFLNGAGKSGFITMDYVYPFVPQP